jgi:hypothetical protein
VLATWSQTPKNSSITILDVLCPFQLSYNIRSMAELANPLPRGARAIGFNAFGWFATFFECALGSSDRGICGAVPPSILMQLCFMRSHHELMDRTHSHAHQSKCSLASHLFFMSCHASLWRKLLESRRRSGLQKNRYAR